MKKEKLLLQVVQTTAYGIENIEPLKLPTPGETKPYIVTQKTGNNFNQNYDKTNNFKYNRQEKNRMSQRGK